MRMWFGVISACALLGACGPRAPSAPRVNTAAQHTPVAWETTRDAAFFRAAVVYETYQIQAAQIAQASARSQAVKLYAASAEAEHRDARRALTVLAIQHGLPMPADDLNANYRAYIERLRGDDPTPFDVRYISQQTLTTMSMAGRYDAFTSTAPDSPLKRWAAARNQAVHDDIQAAHRLAATAH
jgi:predicted outer membrane protein